MLLERKDGLWAPFPLEVVWFNVATDWSFLADWRSIARKADTTAVRDSLEYAELAGKRWRYLAGQGLSAASLAELRRLALKHPAGEFGLSLALRTRGPTGQILGFAFSRRTWANNLMLEFLAASPAAAHGIKGAGRALMQALSFIALWLDCDELWGECTELSKGFYSSLKAKTAHSPDRSQKPENVRDRFQFSRGELSLIVRESQVRIEGCTAEDFREM